MRFGEHGERIAGRDGATPGGRPERRWRRLAGARARAALAVIAVVAVLATGLPALAVGELVLFDRYDVDPRTVTIVAGGRVTCRARAGETLVDGMAPLRIRFEDASLRSPPLAPGESWTATLTEPGLYRYRVEEHDDVEGVVIVE